jgi:large subunit ribosomal protein L13
VNTLSFRTHSFNAGEIERKWYVVDAEGETLGRISSKIAHVLRGKHKATYTPNADTGDFVIVINAEKIRLTGNKMDDKQYIFYSGYTGGQRKATAKMMMQKRPVHIVEHAVKGMLPKNALGRAMYRKLFVYVGSEHPHAAQQPEPFKF